MEKRLIDLSRMADRRGIVTFSNFLNLNELNLFHQIKTELVTDYRLFGGYEFAERQMIAFIPDALYYEWEFPISCLLFQPSHPKFSETLSHRDVLGALMNLGIDRSRIGDLKLEEQKYYIFCEDNISDYILSSLTQIRHTAVTGQKVDAKLLHIEQKFENLEGIVASNRLDAVVSFLTAKSRSQSALLIQSQKVFVNECVASSNAYDCREGDVISVRGFGKYIYTGSSGMTKKGRMKIAMKKYI